MAVKPVKKIITEIPAGSFIGVVSDTHIPARARNMPASLMKALEGAGLILHAGDLVEERVIYELETLAPVEAVAGNMDSVSLHRHLGDKKVVRVNGYNIGIVHGQRGPFDEAAWASLAFSDLTDKIDAVVFGHTHYSLLQNRNGILHLNPGSPVEPRQNSKPSCARIILKEGYLEGEIIYL